jgi:hypothetical protein
VMVRTSWQKTKIGMETNRHIHARSFNFCINAF